MNTTENNKLIEEFMGGTPMSDEQFKAIIKHNEDNNTFHNPPLKKGFDLSYHTDWNALMPVIGKCESVKLDSLGSETSYDRLLGNIMHRLVQQDILSTQRNVVEFIKWYNENK